MREQIHPKVSLVGAGPGDPELITLKGILALNTADVVLYDALIDPVLLKHAPKSAIKFFVGKRVGRHSKPQEDTNQLCVSLAKKHGHVVRLKGGDPFVFGRGGEEIEYIENFGIPTVVVPGITSAVAVPAAAGIPVTKRGISESFWVVTGTTTAGELSRDLALAAQSTATVVVLMGTKKLNEIVQTYRNAGRENLPVAIIQSGTTREEKITAGFIYDIAQKAVENQVESPAIIIIGEVVRESMRLEEVYREFVKIEMQ
ncbi:MAG TPA: uroporphyrinogen-III C-methyltransferase [Algoriphagus sp.]|jgi:uroporphyrin-III C-methyltransferase|uniref:uroporphyrinogen-III C-methyltransferase n=2 Tax=Algoriphagus TaxID=246875 RepID=UPI000C412A3C|nr:MULTISPECIES: uroporphyrinogen-III C-methyltransferase [unclassified Algoriphagus]MAL12202.1 uroporphyrinogen-III C-methyltransferase [Algoriphagus sp.]MAN87140.1 uroporphyrinogen-III C-methyltransferase [Algoriphagus sp.]QYH40888.1 uroporphyrinogen-III C-methyltransferase [Algoriphagus sp. NBT04N3]HAD51366.1 uroporphyrinogen-III C-methyltransferase [Algoriphagus sp.]HAZ25552.1 uroporphyrinogen-III C-methyltransferase [Algoriphagus sp.]|tara:strand:- start:150 stop:923 length:774 start_codon:yes stop_codon:yes gene_type:complete